MAEKIFIGTIGPTGLIVIPKNLREENGFEAETLIDIYSNCTTIFLNKYNYHTQNIKGTLKPINKDGTVLIPKEIRKKSAFLSRCKISLYFDDGIITVNKKDSHCTFCNSSSENVPFIGKHVCKECLTRLEKISSQEAV